MGNSMVPFLPDGTIVIMCRTRHLRPGQVVLFRHEGLDKIKRIVRVQGTQLYVQGDNLAASTDSRSFGWIDRATVVGRVIWPRRIIRGEGRRSD